MQEQVLNAELQTNELLHELMQPQPTVIGIEGGPCGGKTTLVERLQATETEREVVVLPEAASQHIAKLTERGLTVPELAQNDREGFLAFEKDVLKTIAGQIGRAKQDYAGTDAIIAADRVDIGAYLSSEEYRQLLDELDMDAPPMLGLVDQLYYLPSVAVEAPEKYDELRVNNSARYETLEQAQATCRANLEAVRRHPELHVAWGGSFEKKLDNLVGSIIEPESEIELTLEYTDSDVIIQNIKHAKRSGRYIATQEIKQSYHQLEGLEFRLREVATEQGEKLHYFTVKSGEGLKRHELQRSLNDAEYELLKSTQQIGRTLEKTRYRLLQGLMFPDEALKCWSVDFYHQPHLLRWQAEIELYEGSNEEIFPWNYYQKGTRSARPTTTGAKDLALV